MNFYNSIMILSLFLICIMQVMIDRNQNVSKENQKVFFVIYWMIGATILCEWIGNFLNGTGGDAVAFHRLVKFLELLLTPIFPVIYADVILSKLGEIEQQNRLRKIWSVILAFYVVLEIFSIAPRLIFYVDESGYYHYGKWYVLFILFSVSSAMYFFWTLLLFSKHFQNKDVIVVLIIVVFLTTGIIIQLINSNVKIAWLCISVTSILVYMYYNEIIMSVDNLTQLLNQSSYKIQLANIRMPVTILLFDVDAFKNINDSFGHNFGDFVLSIIGKYIKEVYGRYGYCYRIGGDEFCVVLTKTDSYKELNSLFVSKLAEMRESESRIPYVSIGCAKFDPSCQKYSEAIESADQDLYFWKEELKRKRSAELK